MRTYEALYIIQPEVTEDEAQTIASGVESLITEDGGAIVRSEIWGKRRLAYEVNRFNEGIYVLVRFQAPAAVPSKLEAHFKLNESIIRDIVVHFDAKTLRLETEQAKRNEALLESRRLAGPRGEDSDRRDDSPRASERKERTEETVEA